MLDLVRSLFYIESHQNPAHPTQDILIENYKVQNFSCCREKCLGQELPFVNVDFSSRDFCQLQISV